MHEPPFWQGLLAQSCERRQQARTQHNTRTLATQEIDRARRPAGTWLSKTRLGISLTTARAVIRRIACLLPTL